MEVENGRSKTYEVREVYEVVDDGVRPNAVVHHDDDDFTTDFSKDENEDRGNWSGRLDFLLACLGYAVGLGNVWRFPYLCYKNGGAVFFIPYVIMLVFVGIPIFFMELSIGQFTSSGPLTCWECVPLFKGIGLGMMFVSSMVSIYYNMIIAWSLYYLFASFTSHLPWAECHKDWASPFCEDYMWKNVSSVKDCTGQGLIYRQNVGVCYTGDNSTPVAIVNKTLAKEHGMKVKLATEDYLYGRVLHYTDSAGLDDMGAPNWELVLCLLLAWIIVCGSLIKGVKSSGKVVYFTALFPYVVLIILLIRGLTLEGYYQGIEFYILRPKLERLKDSQVWKDAAVQIFFSLSDSWGGLIALASYNRFHNDCLRDTLIVSIGNCLTSFFAGFVIFSFLGFLANRLGVSVDEVATSGVGLAFTVYPAAVVRMPVSTLWAILFFIMLLTLGLDSEFALLETVTTCVFDQFPKTRKYKWAVIIIIASIFFLLGLTMTTNGGILMLQIMDHYAGAWNVLILALCECICVAYIYGFARFRDDIGIMIGKFGCTCMYWRVCSYWWAACWYFFTPVGVSFILIYSWYDYNKVSYGDYKYPAWGEALGWLMTFLVIVGVFLTMFIIIGLQLYRRKPLIELVRPSKYWGPALPKHRRLMARYLPSDSFEVDPWGDEKVDFRHPGGVHEMGTKNAGYEADPEVYTAKF